MRHLTMRVPWHDLKWNGCVCANPAQNPFCVALDRIRVERDEAAECAVAGRSWAELKPKKHPACKAEWTRLFKFMRLGDVPDHSPVGRRRAKCDTVPERHTPSHEE